jgi:hypothetical protein
MHKSLDTIRQAGFMLTVLCTVMASPAAAIDPAETDPLPLEGDREYLYATPARSDGRAGWLAGDNFHIAKKAGIGYTRSLDIGEHALSIGVRGPVMRKQKALGLLFRIRF